MLHTKSLIRRLTHVPWLLTAGLVLGWVGVEKAEAVDVRLKLNRYEVYEHESTKGGKQASVTIEVTAQIFESSAADAEMTTQEGLRVELGLTDEVGGSAITVGARHTNETTGFAGEALIPGAAAADEGLQFYNTRFRVDTLPPIVFGANEKEKKAMITFYPLDLGSTAAADADAATVTASIIANDVPLLLAVVPNPTNAASGDTWQADTVFRLLGDDDETLIASGANPNAGGRRIALKSSKIQLNNEDQAQTATITAYVIGKPFPVDVEIPLKNVDLPTVATANADVFDAFLSGELGRRFDEEITTTVDGTTSPTYTQADVASRDLDYTTPSFPTIKIDAGKSSGSKDISIDPKVEDGGKYPAHILIAPSGYTVTANYDTDANTAGVQTATVVVVPAVIEIIEKGVSQVASFMSVPLGRDTHIIDEDAGETTIEFRVVLGAKVTSDNGQPVKVEIKSGAGVRDQDYQVRLGPSLNIPKGSDNGTVQVIVTPVPDSNEADASFTVEASVNNTEAKSATVTIRDTNKASKNISLTGRVLVPERDDLEIYEKDGDVSIEITATLDGAPLGADAVVSFELGGTAVRELDYTAVLPSLTIPKGDMSNTQTITITPKDDADNSKQETDGETIIVMDVDEKAGTAGDPGKALDPAVAVASLEFKLKNGGAPGTAPTTPSEEDKAPIALADDDTALEGDAGEEFDEVLAEATTEDEDAEVTYLLSGDDLASLGLSFDADTRTISGDTPTAGEAEVTLFATDGTNAASLDYTITIEPEPAATFDVKSVEASHHLLRERAGHATTITLTVTLAEAASEDTEVILDFAGPSEGKTATRDDHFTAQWDADYPRVVEIAKGESKGTAKVSVTPIDNQVEDATSFTVQATPTNGSGAKSEPIVIADDESSSDAIVLSVDPATVKENDGSVSVTVTATLAGGKLDEDVTVTVGISGGSATRDEDYTASFESTQITIASDATPPANSTTLNITPIADEKDETGEVIELSGMATGLATGSAVIALEDGGMMPEDDDMAGDDGEGAGDDDMAGDDGEGGMDEMPFAFAGAVEDQAYTAGTAIADLVVPAAENGEGDVTYRVFDLPAGLAFDAATRTISGTPEAATAGAVEVTVLAQDSAGAGITLTFNITVNAPLSFGDLFGAAGKIVPDSHGLMTEIREFVVGQPVEGLTLPEGAGGTAPLTYSLSPALPAGLTFDAVTRTIAGTPRAASETLYTYTVTDANGASFSMSLQTLPAAFSLADNFPNPFNPATTIKYALPQAADVELTVYNVLGQPVRTLVAEHQNAGRYVVEWDATNDSGHSLSSGMYFYRLQAGGEFLKVKKMLLLK